MSDGISSSSWRDKAKEIRLIAGRCRSVVARTSLVFLARGYERLADHADANADPADKPSDHPLDAGGS